MKIIFLLIFPLLSFGYFEISSVKLNCDDSSVCKEMKETFKSLKRRYVDEDHFRSIIKVYSQTTGVEFFKYKVEQEKGNKKLFVTWKPLKKIKNIDFSFVGSSLDIPSILPLQEDEFFSSEKLLKTRTILTELYRSQGYNKVYVKTKIDSKGNGYVNVSIKVVTGKPLLLKKLIIYSSSVDLKRIFEQKLDEYVNKAFNQQKIRQSLDELRGLLYNHGYYYFELKYLIEDLNDGVKVRINLEKIINGAYSIRFLDRDDQYASELKGLLKEKTITAKRVLSTTNVKEIVVKKLSKEGYENAIVSVEKKIQKNIFNEEYITYTINIKKQNKTILEKIKFKGNNEISSEKLVDLFYEHATDQAHNNIVDEKYFNEFLNIIKEEYVKKGFVNILLESPDLIRDKSGYVTLVYRIREGARAKIRKINISGISKAQKFKVLSLLKLKVGDAFNPIAFKTYLATIKEYFKNEGFYFSELLSERMNKIAIYNDDNSKVDLYFDFDLGKRLNVGEVVIIGNNKTRSKVIRRELVIELGNTLRVKDLAVSRGKILSTGLFSSVVVKPILNSSNYADILISVKEKDYGLFEIAPGIRTDLGPKISTKISYNNIDGLDKQISFQGQVNRRFDLNSIDENRRGDEDNLIEYLAQVNYSERYLFDLNLGLNSSVSFSRQRLFSFDADIQKISNTISSDVYPWLNLSLTHQLEVASQYNATATDQNGEFQIGSLTPGLTLDFRNNRINPTSGSYFSLSMEFANETFGSKSNEEIEIDFNKFISRNRFYIPVGKGVLAISIAGGVQKNLATSKNSSTGKTEGYIPSLKVFRLAGLDNVRGFEDDEINRTISGEDISSARIDDKAYMFNLKFEPRMFLSDNSMIGIFYDAGRVFVNEYDLSKLRSSAGVSFKYITPVGSLDFDYGIKLLRKRDQDGRLESPGRLHVSIGFF